MRDYTNDMANVRFASYGKRKFNKKMYYEDVEGAYLAGILIVIEELHQENIKAPYETTDELLADLQETMVHMYNTFRMKNLKHDSKKMTIENLVYTVE